MKKLFLLPTLLFALLLFVSPVYAVDCSCNISGNCTISSSCSFTGSFNGTDAGTGDTNTSTLTVSSGVLTIAADQTLTAGSFDMSGAGSIVLGSNAAFTPGLPIYIHDADADGYPSSTTLYSTSDTGRRRRNLMTALTIDCADDNASNNLTCTGGTGNDGAVTISSNTNFTTDTIAGGRSYADGIAYRVNAPSDSATSVTRHSGSDTLSNGIAAGDEVLLINLQGWDTDYADAGNYEFMTVDSVTASTITFTSAITKSFDGSTASNQKVVIQRVPNYTDVTINSGVTLNAAGWDGLSTTPSGAAGYYTGIIAFKATGTVTVTGNIRVNGDGYRGAVGMGGWTNRHDGGEAYCGDNDGSSPDGGDTSTAYKSAALDNGLCGGGAGNGGGYSGNLYGGTTGTSAGGAGGPGSTGSFYGGGGGGGGYGTGGNGGQGGSGYGDNGGSSSGDGGAASNTCGDCNCEVCAGGGGGGGYYGDANLTTLFYGSGGGAGGAGYDGTGGSGGDGGGIIYIEGDTISVSGTISSTGANGADGATGGSGGVGSSGAGGAGGSIYLAGASITLGTSKVTATGGSGATRAYDGGNGGVGRIVVDSDSITGTTNPTYTNP